MSYVATQAVLTAAFNVVAGTGLAYLAIAFVISAIRFWHECVVTDADMDSLNPQHVEQLQDDEAAIGCGQTATVTSCHSAEQSQDDTDINLASLEQFDAKYGQIAEPAITDMCQVLPFSRPQPEQQEDYSTWTVPELRSLFNRKGLAWRNAASDGKHLRKQEMLNILMEVQAA